MSSKSAPLDLSSLSSPTFSSLDYFNAHFKTTASLTALESFASNIALAKDDLDTQISLSIQNQATQGETSSRDISQATDAILSLQSKIGAIATSAGKSEEMVRTICKDIKQLDYAKRHLQTTITALKRLHMLVTAVGQLETMTDERNYRDAANLLDAVGQLAVHFEEYQDVPKIAELQRTVDQVREQLESQIFKAFNAIGELASTTADPEGFEREEPSSPSEGDANNQFGFTSLHEACLVVDALGERARSRQISCFCQQQLQPYTVLFPPNNEVSSLDQVDRRFAWFRRLLKNIDERFTNVFPPHWHLQYKLCLMFLQQSRDQLLQLLTDDTSSDSENVIVIVKALQKSLHFEKEMTGRFERDYGSSVANTTIDPSMDHYDNDMEYDEDGEPIDPKSAQGIKLRYARERARKKSMANKTGTVALSPSNDRTEDALLPINGMLSASFDNFMEPYVSLERQNMEEQLASTVADTEIDTRGDLPVFTSSVKLFVYMKNSINRCSMLTTGRTFFDLYKAYKNALSLYCKCLTNKMPQPYVQSSGLGAINLGGGGNPNPNPSRATATYKIPPEGEVTVAYVIDTCEYCVDTIEALEELIKDKIDETYKESIDFEDAQDELQDVTSTGLRVLVSGLENRCGPFFKELSNTSWGSVEDVGEESNYVRGMTNVIVPFFTSCQKTLPSSYYRMCCDKFAKLFTESCWNHIVRVKRFSEMATQQLLLDLYSLRKLVMSLPSIGGGIAPSSFTAVVTKEFARIELLLKLVGTPIELLVDVMKQQWTDCTLKDLQLVMGLKGLKRAQQTELLYAFGEGGGGGS